MKGRSLFYKKPIGACAGETAAAARDTLAGCREVPSRLLVPPPRLDCRQDRAMRCLDRIGQSLIELGGKGPEGGIEVLYHRPAEVLDVRPHEVLHLP